MENASKALIIAGSILLSILIIALGMYIFSSSSSTSDVSVLSETEIQTFNAKFEKYKGEQLGSSVDSLISALRSNATSNRGTSEKIPNVNFTPSNGTPIPATGQIVLNSEGENDTLSAYTTALTNMSNAIERSHRYTVTMEYSNDGLINEIEIAYE